MTNPTLERAARAAAFWWHSYLYGPEVAQGYADADWKDWIDQVRAVLMAIRAPEKDILKAAEDLREWEGGFFHEPSASEAWPAMIDQILSEEAKWRET